MGRAEDLFDRLVAHGENAVNDLITDRQSEELFLDFKRSSDGGSGPRLHDHDRTHLARAIAGFGNSEGGIIVWGVDCSGKAGAGDLPGTKPGIADPKRFVSWLEGAVSGCTLPAHPGVRHHAIESPGGTNGFVVSYVPRSHLAPHQTIRPSQYLIRAGSSFVPAPHGVLAGLFGRRPQPFVFHAWNVRPAKCVALVKGKRAEFKLGFVLGSVGPGIARDLYVNVQLHPPRGGSQMGIAIADPQNWSGRNMYSGVLTNLVCSDSFKLAPGARVQVFEFGVVAQPPFDSELVYEITFGHGSSPTRSISVQSSSAELKSAYQRFIGGSGNTAAGRRFVEEFMRLDAGHIYGAEGYRSR